MSAADHLGKKGGLLKRSKGPVEDDPQTTDEYGNARTMDPSGAHRDVVYTPAGMFGQIATVYKTQMKRFFRDKILIVLLGMILVVPVGVYLMTPLYLVESDVSNTYMAAALTLAPVMCALVAAMTCGSLIPQEFNERTAFMSLPLPMTRTSFCIGKFLAGLSLALAVILAVYGFAIISSSMVADVTYPGSIGASVLVSVATMFSYCCVTFLVSVFMKRSGTMASLLLLAGILPALFILIGMAVPVDALGYLPFYGFDLAVMHLGQPPFGVVASILGFMGSNAPFLVGSSAAVMVMSAIVVGVICMVLAVVKVKRRDM